MAINVNNLTTYVEEHNLPILRNAVLGSRTSKEFNLYTGVKGATALNILNTTIAFGDGANCGWNEAGESALSQRVLTPGYVKINMSFCDKQLLKTWANYEVRVAAGQKTLPFEEDFVNGIQENVAQAIETAIWMGDTSTSNTNVNTNKFDGIIKIAENSSLAETVTVDSSTSMNVLLNEVVKAIPYEAYSKGDVVIYTGRDVYDAYIRELIANGNLVINLGNGFDKVAEPETIIIPGTRVTVIPVNGLNGSDKVFGSYKENFIYGTDMEGDAEKVEFWYSQDNREFRLAIEFVAGTQIAFPDMVVEGKITPANA